MEEQMVTRLLSELATVRTGLVLSRKRTEPEDPALIQYPLLSMKSIRSNGTIDTNALDTFFAQGRLHDAYITHCGDVIVRLTSPFTAVVVDASSEGIVVPTNFAIIRIRDKSLLAEYLVWYLGTHAAKKVISTQTTGHVVVAIRPHFFSDMEIVLPTYEQQKIIAQYHKFMFEEQELTQRLMSLKKLLQDMKFMGMIQKIAP